MPVRYYIAICYYWPVVSGSVIGLTELKKIWRFVIGWKWYEVTNFVYLQDHHPYTYQARNWILIFHFFINAKLFDDDEISEGISYFSYPSSHSTIINRCLVRDTKNWNRTRCFTYLSRNKPMITSPLVKDRLASKSHTAAGCSIEDLQRTSFLCLHFYRPAMIKKICRIMNTTT